MIGKHVTKAIVAAAACGFTVPAVAQTADANVQAEIAALKAEIAQLKQAQGENWLNERRAEEVKTLVREVLADADTRASLLQDGVMAGHNGKNFFLQSADGAFSLSVGGQIQVRYIANFQDDRDDEWMNGFQLRRTKLSFGGHIASPRIGYEIVLSAQRDSDSLDGYGDGDVYVQDVLVSYDLTDELEIKAGKFKLPFARQELISSKRQLAVDRSSVNEYFTLNRAEQLQLTYSTDVFKLYGSISDGANSEHSDFNADAVDYALTGRADVKLAGDWSQARDVVAWEDELGIFVGAAAHWEQLDEDAGFPDGDFFALTADALVKTGPVAVLGAVYWAEADDELGDPEDAFGAVVEGGFSVTEQWQPFVRWEWLDVDGADEETQIATVGVNYYLAGHNAKFTADVAWKYAGDNPGTLGNLNGGEYSSGLGFDSGSVTDDEDQIAIRAQFQLLF